METGVAQISVGKWLNFQWGAVAKLDSIGSVCASIALEIEGLCEC